MPPKKRTRLVNDIPPLLEFAVQVLDEHAAVRFCLEKSLIHPIGKCSICQSNMTGRDSSKPKMLRCTNKECGKRVSAVQGSLFARSKIPLNMYLLAMYCWVNKMSREFMMHNAQLASESATSIVQGFRSLTSDNVSQNPVQIGGPGIIVEIDESVFCCRKYSAGQKEKEVWVFGGVEKTNERNLFLVVVPNRKRETLLQIIAANVKDGSTIHSDCFKSYYDLAEHLKEYGVNDIEHLSVNHQNNFVDPITKACTNAIEGTWNGIKMGIAPRNRTRDELQEHLNEFVWRRRNDGRVWAALLELIAAKLEPLE